MFRPIPFARRCRSTAMLLAALAAGAGAAPFALEADFGGTWNERLSLLPLVDLKSERPSHQIPGLEEPKLPPELEKQLQTWLNGIKEIKRKAWAAKMAGELDEMATSTGLSAAEKKTLEAAARDAIDEHLVGWLDKLDDLYRGQLSSQPQLLEELRQQPFSGNEETVPDEADPIEQEAWVKRWKAALTPPQAQKWEKVLAARRAKADEELKETVKTMADATREKCRDSIAQQIEGLKDVLTLAEDRVAVLEALGREAVEKSLALWTPRAQTTLREIVSQFRQQQQQGAGFAMGDFSIELEPAEQPEVQPAWTAGLARLLTPEELQRLEGARAQRKARRVRYLARLLLLFLDEQLALTAQQRERLLPIAQKMVLDQGPGFLPEDARQDNYLAPATFLQASALAPEKEVREIIGEAEWQLWKKASAPETQAIPGLAPIPAPGDAPPARDANAEAEPLEQTISNFMAAQAARRRARMVAPLLLQVEDAARVAGLSPDVCARLRTGARGATERWMKPWIEHYEQVVRGSLNVNEVTADELPQQLASLESFDPGELSAPPADQAIWKKCLAAELTAGQRAAWQKEIDARRQYRDQTIIGIVLMELDRRLPLNGEQWQKLETLLTALFKSHRGDLANFSSQNGGNPWYLQSHTRYVPLAGLDKSEMQKLLGQARWERWSGTDEFQNAQNMWSNLKNSRQNHQW